MPEEGKFVAIPETAALGTDDIGGLRTLNIKRACWEQVFAPAVNEQFPQLTMVNWFGWNKVESETGAAVDWTVAADPAIRYAFTAALPEWYRFADEPHDCGERSP